jgi:hypothetical protein
VFVEYNAGSPQIVLDADRADGNTNIKIAKTDRIGSDIHIHEYVKYISGNTGNLVNTRFFETDPFSHVSGAAISEEGTRNIKVTAGVFWECLNRFTTTETDTSAAGTFTYAYSDNAGGHTLVAASTQIDNTQYDDGTGTLATLANNQYGVHWVYLETDSDLVVVYGTSSYTLVQAENATVPTDIPRQLNTHGRLIGKIIILKSSATFLLIESSFDNTFASSPIVEHSSTSGLQGGTVEEYFHITSAEHVRFLGGQPEQVARSALAALEIDFASDSIKTKTITGNSTFTFTGISSATLDRVITLEVTGAFTITLPASVQNAAAIENAYTGSKVNWIYFNVVDSGTPKVVASIVIED